MHFSETPFRDAPVFLQMAAKDREAEAVGTLRFPSNCTARGIGEAKWVE
jgi:hypothetical protein